MDELQMSFAEKVAFDRQAMEALGVKVNAERIGRGDYAFTIEASTPGALLIAALLSSAAKSIARNGSEDVAYVMERLEGDDPSGPDVRNLAVASIARGVATAIAMQGAILSKEDEE